MKRGLLSLFILVVFYSSGKALDLGHWKLGLEASPSLAWLNPETTSYERDGIKLGFRYGLMIDVPISKSTFFSSGVFLNHTGGKLNFGDIRGEGITIVSRNYSFSYLDLPATLKLRTPEFGYYTYYAKFGLGLGFLVGSSANESFGSTVRKVEDFNKETRFLSSSLIAGVGMEYAFGGTTALMIGLTYNNGFLGVLKGEDNLGRSRKAKASFLEVSLGVIF